MAVVTATQAETGAKANSLPVAGKLAAAGQMLEALRAVQAAHSLDEVRALVDSAIRTATTPPELSEQDEDIDLLVF